VLFNSFEFLVFLPVVFGLYWFVAQRHLKAQNLLLLAASYTFYGWWDWRFLGLVVLSTLVDFLIGIQMQRAEDRTRRKRWLWASLAVNLGILGYFKYAGFFVDNWIAAWESVGVTMHATTTNVILPIGISFYTFQTLSYTLDIHRGKIKATRDPVAFAAYVAFFPQLVAGPIERAVTFLPQITSPRTFTLEQGRDGMRLILWGLFKKVVVAGTCAPYVDMCMADPSAASGSTLVLGTFLFYFQMYADFSGYSDIAIGTAKLFGFELMTNFKFPYLTRNFAEFWRSWHVSLNTWIIDYVFMPLVLAWRKAGKWGVLAATVLTFALSGLWHGAHWTFILWGVLNGLLFLPFILKGALRRTDGSVLAQGRWLPAPREALQVATVFTVTALLGVFFRAPDLATAFEYALHIPTQLLNAPTELPGNTAAFLGTLVGMEYVNRENPRRPLHLPWLPIRWAAYMVLAYLIVDRFNAKEAFIYFQF
jgi:D-alanyl-lipoteichoic acid acyltransferase DltB (MBOAT superfamily)